ncbi:hypothetical protein BJ875DRAFT_426062 [Amylocarpus encephaloides]|uniref:NAD(P)-binding protein n=1 Tax=Amylocarpus encephaloides TaxID=45428 RepID=A0A9P7YHL2_9HELO|nr:hypothetical protein BJ875DRAFT_426062 [Amylocarpus encephaloides]
MAAVDFQHRIENGFVQSSGTRALAAGFLFNVDGLVVVVRGAHGRDRLGFMMAKALALNSATVYTLGRRVEALQSAVKSIGKKTVKTVVCDVTSKASLKIAVCTIVNDAGYLNLLVCNAGIGGPYTPQTSSEVEKTLEEFATSNWVVLMEEFTHTFEVNTLAVWYTILAFLRLLDKENKKGNVSQSSQVVTIDSINSFNKVNTAGFAYSQSKAACTHLMKNLSVALPKWNIRANAPGLFPSEMFAPIIARGGINSDMIMIPLARAGDLQDIGAALLYLASIGGAYCNGTILVTDGGRLSSLFPSTF